VKGFDQGTRDKAQGTRKAQGSRGRTRRQDKHQGREIALIQKAQEY